MKRGEVERDIWSVLFAVEREVDRGAELHGAGFDRPDIPSWMGGPDNAAFGLPTAEDAREHCEQSHSDGYDNWAAVLVEEVCEALEEVGDEDKLRTELIQVAAVATAWVRAIDRRAGSQPLLKALRSDEEC